MKNEAETRRWLIDPTLEKRGYDAAWKLKMETPAPVDPIGFKGRRRSGGGRTDYLICVQADKMPMPLPVGVIEAKAESADPLKGMQQAKGYADCQRFHVQYVFATNGHLYGEFDKPSQMPSGPFPLVDFPTHADLTQRYARDTGLELDAPEAAMLFQGDPKGGGKSRYYQDAAIRAAFGKILECEGRGVQPRALLSLATGSGKTVIAANLLWRLHEGGRLTKPALFLCDRDELRTQAYNKLSKAFPEGAVRTVRSERGRNAAQNAKVHIATYQTLGLDDDTHDGEAGASFLSEHYEDDAFSVIVIDECHRSAWGRWSEVLRRNPSAIVIGLTATPRMLRDDPHNCDEDCEITANNHYYFGDPVYEYTLVEAQEDGYLAACEIVRLRPSIDGLTFTREELVEAGARNARTGQPVEAKELQPMYGKQQFDNDLILPERIQAMCADLFARLCESGGPEQKVIVFCARDLHADRVAMELQRCYAKWCKERGQSPKEHYAFKCTESGGSDLIELMRGSAERCFIACSVDLLSTGVDIERLNAVVFFRYLKSAITFYQMVGRGTRIHEETQKYKFWLYDYTGVTDLFGTDFITDGRSGGNSGGGGAGGGDDDELWEPPVVAEARPGPRVVIDSHGHFILQRREGRDVMVPIEEYRDAMLRRVVAEAATLTDFRGMWVETQKRQAFVDHLAGEQYSAAWLREWAKLGGCDDFDLFAHFGYHAAALTREARAQGYLVGQREWFGKMRPEAAAVLQGLGRQFAVGGTEELEREMVWEVPEIKRAGGLDALRSVGKPGEVVREAKVRLFGG